MLTPMGLRQRYLLGKYMKTKLGSSFDEKEMSAYSTEYFRTLQSMQAELLGYTGGNVSDSVKWQLNEGQMKSNKVPFNLRRQSDKAEELGNLSAPNGFLWKPVYSNMNRKDYEARISHHSCRFSESYMEQLVDHNDNADEDIFESWLYLVDAMRPYFKLEFGLSE